MCSSAAIPGDANRQAILSDGLKNIDALLVGDIEGERLRSYVPDALFRTVNLSCGHVVTSDQRVGTEHVCRLHGRVRVHSLALNLEQIVSALHNEEMSDEATWEEIQNACQDPISRQLLSNPQVLTCGHVCSNELLQIWFERSNRCPVCSEEKKGTQLSMTKTQEILREVQRISARLNKPVSDETACSPAELNDKGKASAAAPSDGQRAQMWRENAPVIASMAAACMEPADCCCARHSLVSTEPRVDLVSEMFNRTQQKMENALQEEERKYREKTHKIFQSPLPPIPEIFKKT
jgi:hypothetical protein